MQDGVLNVPHDPIVHYIEGDGIGADITPVMMNVVNASVAKAYAVFAGFCELNSQICKTVAGLKPASGPAQEPGEMTRLIGSTLMPAHKPRTRA